MNLDFYMPTRTVSGKNCVLSHPSVFGEFGKKCLVVTSGSSAYKSGAFDDLKTVFASQGIRYEVYDRIGENPLVTSCFEAGRQARDFGADYIVGVGGGSPLDASKAVALFATNDLEHMGIYNPVFDRKPLPLILIGTTAGTGSEVTNVAVLTTPQGIKRAVRHDWCYPVLSFLDYKYTFSLPLSVTISTTLDAFAHSVEGYFAVGGGDVGDVFAQKAIPTVFGCLKALSELPEGQMPDEALRAKLYYGSIWAGLVLNACNMGFPHPLGYSLTENFGIPHGRACTAFMGVWLDLMKERSPEKYGCFLSMCGESRETVNRIISDFTDVGHVAMTPEQVEGFVTRFHGNKNYLNTPGGFDDDQCRRVLTKLFVR